MAFLKQSLNGTVMSVAELRDDISIGRSNENAIVVEDPTVSQIHVRVISENDQWWVVDCDSTNGLRVNGRVVERAELVEGLVFSLGAQEFQFSVAPPGNLDRTLRIKKSWIPGVYYTE